MTIEKKDRDSRLLDDSLDQQVEKVRKGTIEEEMSISHDRFSWKMTIFLIASTICMSLVVGYFICLKLVWDSDTNVRLSERVKKYEELVQKNPDEPKSHVELGFTYFLQEDYKKAINQYKMAISLDNEYYPAHLNLAFTYFEVGETENALKAGKIAENLAPRDYKSKLIMGRCYRSLKMFKESKEALFAAQNYSPGNVEVIYEIGCLAEDQGNKSEAEEIFREALSYDPNYKEAKEALKRVTK